MTEHEQSHIPNATLLLFIAEFLNTRIIVRVFGRETLLKFVHLLLETVVLQLQGAQFASLVNNLHKKPFAKSAPHLHEMPSYDVVVDGIVGMR